MFDKDKTRYTDPMEHQSVREKSVGNPAARSSLVPSFFNSYLSDPLSLQIGLADVTVAFLGQYLTTE